MGDRGTLTPGSGRSLQLDRDAAQADALRYLHLLFEGLPTQWLIELRALGRSPRVVRCWHTLDNAARAAAWCVELAARGFDVYAGVQPRHSRRGGAAAVAALHTLYADLDCGPGKALESKTHACKRLESMALLGLGPTHVIDSGGGLHAYWLLREPLRPEGHFAWREVMRAIARSLAADISVTDLPRILRVPGTLNWKQRDNPRRVSWLASEKGRRFTLLDFDPLVPPAQPQTASPLPSANAAPRIVQAIRAAAWNIRERRDRAGKLVAFVLDEPCPFCPGPPVQAELPRRGTAHITPRSGALRCKRMNCAAGAAATGLAPTGEARGLTLAQWSAAFAAAGANNDSAPGSTALPRPPGLPGVRRLSP